MKYKCQRGLVFQGYCMKILMSMLLYGNCYGGDSCYCWHEGCDDDGCGWRIRSVTT